MPDTYHSVILDEEKCKGCTNCIKRCPTEAIRVREGKAHILPERCIDCGECIRVCPHHAKRARHDDFSRLADFKYKVALPAPALFGQFSRLVNIDYILNGLLDIGFDDVFEVSRAAEIISDFTRKMIRGGGLPMPVISSACPAVTRLISVRFPSLCENVLPLISPMHLAGMMAKKEAAEKTGLPEEDIGTFFISPCAAKVTDVVRPTSAQKSWVDCALSMADVYPRLLEKINKITEPKPMARSGIIGVSWANSGGEAEALLQDMYLAADGMENVKLVLEELESAHLKKLEFAELGACPGGCVGGVFTVENAYVAKARIQRLRKYLPVARSYADEAPAENLKWDSPLEYSSVMRLSDDIGEAMNMMEQMDSLCEELPGLDCGSCGAPSCRALAEDIVTRGAQLNDCIFVLRQEASSAGISVSQGLMTPGREKPGDGDRQ